MGKISFEKLTVLLESAAGGWVAAGCWVGEALTPGATVADTGATVEITAAGAAVAGKAAVAAWEPQAVTNAIKTTIAPPINPSLFIFIFLSFADFE
jgi:hypothetical protein